MKLVTVKTILKHFNDEVGSIALYREEFANANKRMFKYHFVGLGQDCLYDNELDAQIAFYLALSKYFYLEPAE